MRPLKVKAGVVGLGVGEQHAEAFATYGPRCELVGVCDLDPERAERVGQRFGAPLRTTDAATVLTHPDIDVVSICTYDDVHADQAIQALEHGKHVMVEKPVCLTPDEARRVRRALVSSGCRLTSNLLLRLSPRFARIKRLVEGNALGELFYIEGDYLYGRHHKITDGWRGDLPFYNVVYGGGVHVIDLMRWMVGSEVKEVTSYGNRLASRGTKFRFDDCVASLFRFENGCVGKSVSAFASVQPHFHNVRIYGTRGTVLNDYDAARFYRSPDPAVLPETLSERYPGVHKGALVGAFLDTILDGATPAVDEEDVFKVMDICFAVQRSLEVGGPIDVEYSS